MTTSGPRAIAAQRRAILIAWAASRQPNKNETRYEQAHYKCEPATTIEDLEAVARFAKSSSYTSFRTAVKLAHPDLHPQPNP